MTAERVVVAGTYDDFADAFLAHVRSAHPEWPFPDAAVRMVGENMARLTGGRERLEDIGPITVEPDRRHGLATQLLDRVIADAPSRGVRWVEAYPFNVGMRDGSAHRGARAMFDERG